MNENKTCGREGSAMLIEKHSEIKRSSVFSRISSNTEIRRDVESFHAQACMELDCSHLTMSKVASGHHC